VEWAWSHPEKVRQMSEEARQAYETRYTAEKNYELLMQIYEGALRRHAPGCESLPREVDSHAVV
jgi:hypothetical protein